MNNNDKKERPGITAFLSLLIFALSVGLVILTDYSGITVMAESRAERGVFNKRAENEMVSELISDRSGYLRIPLPDTVEEGDIDVIEEPLKKRIFIQISGVDEDYYKENFFSGDMTGIRDVKYGFLNGISTVELETEKIRVPVTDYIRGSFYVNVASPAEIYDRVVVIDPGHGGDDPGSIVYGVEEKVVTANVALKLGKELESRGAKVYLINREEASVSESDIARTVNECDADLLLTLHTGADADTRTTKGVEARASDDMKEKAEILTGMLSASCDQRDLKVSEWKVPEGLSDIPCIWLRLGVITNKEEALKMNSEGYQDKAVKTIADFILNRL